MQDLRDYARSRGAFGLVHDVSDMRLHGRFGNFEFGRNFFIGPSLRKPLDDTLFPFGQLKPLLGVMRGRFSSGDRFHHD